MKEQDTYYEPIIREFPGMTVRIYRPILTPEEREKRMKAVYKAVEDLLKDKEKR